MTLPFCEEQPARRANGTSGAVECQTSDSLRFIAARARCLLWRAEIEDVNDRLDWKVYIPDEDAARRFLPVAEEGWPTYRIAWYESRLPEDQERTNVYGGQEIRAGRSYSQEFRCRRRDGEVRWLHEEVELETLAPGQWRAVGICTDITERKRAEERLRRVLSSAECLLWHGTVVEIDGELDWRIEMWDEDASQRFLPLDVPPGEPYSEVWYLSKPQEDRDRMAQIGNHAIRAGKSRYAQEFRCLQRDGQVRWFWEDVDVQPDGPGRWQLVGVCTDITERKRAEEAIWESEEQLRVMWENSLVAMRLTDGDGTMLMVNEAFCQMAGLPRDALLGQPLSIIYPPEEAETVLRKYWQRFRDRAVPPHREAVMRLWNGKSGWFEFSHAFVECGQPLLLSIFRNATERREAEEALRRKEEQLRHSQKMEAVGRLAGGIAHDFNNMLAVINGYSDLLLQMAPGDSPLKTGLEEIHRAGERAASLTRQLLAFSRRQMLAPRELDMNEVVASLTRMLRRLIREDIELVTVLSPSLGPVKVDPGQVEQVLLNLVVNARDAMPAGGTLTIRTQNAVLEDSEALLQAEVRPGPYVMLSVADNGCGMTAEMASQIFEPFFTTKPIGQGTGLGLSTVYGIVKQSDGHIEVESEADRGTTFRVYLPRLEAACAAESPASSEEPPCGTETILLVEDEAMVRRLARQVLQARGYSVLEARDGEEALREYHAHEGNIDLVLSDVVMPAMSGPELLARLRQFRPDLKTLLMSGYADDDRLRQDLTLAGTELLRKPFLPETLARCVRDALDTG